MDEVTTTPAPAGQLADTDAIAAFILAGNATFTLVSERTGTRFTYRVRAKRGDDEGTGPLFVQVLTGPDGYDYLGCIWRDDKGTRFTRGRKSTIGRDAPSSKAFAWLARAVFGRGALEGATFFHEGRCCRCGRQLTVPSSISSGWGPDCARKAA